MDFKFFLVSFCLFSILPQKSIASISSFFIGCSLFGSEDSVSVSKIVISKRPTKTQYVIGSKFDSSGLIVTSIMTNNNEKTISDYTLDVSDGYIFTTIGNIEITVSYRGYKTSFIIQVIDKTVESIEIKSAPLKLVYFKNETLDTSGMVLTVHYDNKTSIDISTGWNETPTSFTNVGKQFISVLFVSVK